MMRIECESVMGLIVRDYALHRLFVTADMNHNMYIWNSELKDIVWENKYHTDTIVDILLPHS